MSTDRLRARDLRRLGYGIYARADIELTEHAILSAVTRNDPIAVARGPSAARRWAFPLPRSLQEWKSDTEITPIHLTANGHPRRSTSLFTWSRQRVSPEAIVMFGGMRITDRVRTWLDLSPALTCEELVQIGDHLVRRPRPGLENRRRPHASLERLAVGVREHSGEGRPLLRRALAQIRVGSDSPAETLLRLAAARAGLPEPVLNTRQFSNGVDLGEPDLAWPAWKVCVEHEGPSHLTKEQQQRDIARRERRDSQGWIEVQTVATDLHRDCRRGLRRLKDALRRQGWHPDAPSPETPPRP